MAIAVGRANEVDQKLQSVLYLMDKLDTKYGVDGRRGDFMIMALGRASQSMGMGAIGGKDDMTKVEKALTDKLKDPKFCANALEKLKQVDPPTKDSIIAMQTVLSAIGHTIPRNDKTRMFSGAMDDATKFALDNTTADGKRGAAVYAAAGFSPEVARIIADGGDTTYKTRYAMDGSKNDGLLNQSFQTAVAGVTALPAQAQKAPDMKVSMVTPERTF